LQARLAILNATIARQRENVAGAVGKIAQQVDGQTDEFLSASASSRTIWGKARSCGPACARSEFTMTSRKALRLGRNDTAVGAA